MSRVFARWAVVCLALSSSIASSDAWAMAGPKVSEAGLRLGNESAYKLFVTEGGEFFAATTTGGAKSRQSIRHRSREGIWTTIRS